MVTHRKLAKFYGLEARYPAGLGSIKFELLGVVARRYVATAAARCAINLSGLQAAEVVEMDGLDLLKRRGPVMDTLYILQQGHVHNLDASRDERHRLQTPVFAATKGAAAKVKVAHLVTRYNGHGTAKVLRASRNTSMRGKL